MAAKKKTAKTKASDSDSVDAYLKNLKHPLVDPVKAVRKTILKKDALRLVFWRGDRVDDESGFLEGDYPDGRRLAILSGAADLASRKKALVSAVKTQLKHIHD